jgi:hypothetical protein
MPYPETAFTLALRHWALLQNMFHLGIATMVIIPKHVSHWNYNGGYYTKLLEWWLLPQNMFRIGITTVVITPKHVSH